ncbi:MAG: hypothetical protein AAFV07_09180, partial [Bacteroidota bacterium]
CHCYQHYERMRTQDRNASRFGEGPAAQRVITKASSGYAHTDWDLVDAVSSGTVRLAELPPHHLPREMRGMNQAQKQAYINRKRSERMAIRQEIRQMSQQKRRQSPQAQTRPARSPQAQSQGQQPHHGEGRTLDQAVIKATRKQELKKQKTARPTVRPAAKRPTSARPAVRPASSPSRPARSVSSGAAVRPTRSASSGAAVRPTQSGQRPTRPEIRTAVPVQKAESTKKPATTSEVQVKKRQPTKDEQAEKVEPTSGSVRVTSTRTSRTRPTRPTAPVRRR